MITIITLVATAIVAGLIVFTVLKLTIKAIIKTVKALKAKGAKKVLVADINSMAEKCTNKKSLKDLEKLANQGYTHVVAGINDSNEIVDKIQLIQNEDDETAYEVVDLLGDEGAVLIEA